METSRFYGENKQNVSVRRDLIMEDTRSFDEVFVAVKYKIQNRLQMMTAKEELMKNFIKEWTDTFGYEALK